MFRIIVAVAATVILFSIEAIMKYAKKITSLFYSIPSPCRAVLYGLLTALIVVCGAYGTNQFIYFQF